MADSKGTELRKLLLKNVKHIVKIDSEGEITVDLDFVAVIASVVYETADA